MQEKRNMTRKLGNTKKEQENIFKNDEWLSGVIL